MTESLQTLYAKNLLQSFGYPLRFPEPKPGLPTSYIENGLQIGDVGYVDDTGQFEVLFNICLSSDHDLHQGKHLAGLVDLAKFEPNDAAPNRNALPSGCIICHCVQGPHDDSVKRDEIFLSSSPSGAILILPLGAVHQHLISSKEEQFRKIAESYAINWCQFASRSSLYLITGFYKASSWHLASFHDVRPTKDVLVRRDGTGRYFSWHCNCDRREGMSEDQRDNQTVLISGFKVEVRNWDKQIFVQKLSSHSGCTWIGVISWLVSLTITLVSFCEYMASKIPFDWWGSAMVDVNHHPALSPPFHPSDTINRHLLDECKNSDVQVAITHDSQWLSMLGEDELSLEDMADEGRFRVFLEERYMSHSNSDNIVYLQKKVVESRHEISSPSPKISITPRGTRQFVITHIRAEGIAACLRRIPIGFYIIFQFNCTTKRSKCESPSLCDNMLEWDDEIVLPAELTIEVEISIIASFELEPVLGNGELLFITNTSVSKLTESESTCFLPLGGEANAFSGPSILLTLEERRFDYFADRGHCNSKPTLQEHLYPDAAEETNNGYNGLLHYYNYPGRAELEQSIECFGRALELCPSGHECRATALSNLATGKLVHSQVYGTISDLEDSITRFREALALRPDRHLDRPATLLYLAQALLCRHRMLQWEASVANEIERLATEIKQICHESSSYYHRAANLVVQTLGQNRVLVFGDLPEVNKLVSELRLSARIPPDWHFDRPYRLINFGTALCRCFEMTGDLDCLEEAISVMKEAVELIPDVRFDKPRLLALLGDALHAHCVQRGDVASFKSSILMFEDAVQRAPEGHLDKPSILASLGGALRARFAKHGNFADLQRSISVVEEALKLVPDDHAEKPWLLTSLGDGYRLRFAQCGDVADLESSVSTIYDALRRAPDSHVKYPWLLAVLGASLCVRFVQRGDSTDSDIPSFEGSVSMVEDAVDRTSNSHIRWPWMLTKLGAILLVRFIHTNISNLDKSISVTENSVYFTPTARLDWEKKKKGTGTAHDLGDLERVISMHQRAIEIIPDCNPHRAGCLTLLASSLIIRFRYLGNTSDLEEAISACQSAIDLLPDDHPDKPECLNILALSFRARFEHFDDLSDIDKAVSAHEDAVELIRDGHYYKPQYLKSISLAVEECFWHLFRSMDR